MWVKDVTVNHMHFMTNCHILEPESLSSNSLPHSIEEGLFVPTTDEDSTRELAHIVEERARIQVMFKNFLVEVSG